MREFLETRYQEEETQAVHRVALRQLVELCFVLHTLYILILHIYLKRLKSVVGKAVVNHVAEVQGSIPSTNGEGEWLSGLSGWI